ncbi:hypothetical protein [Flavobacterium sp.]|uniref:hypothetical protein n=1 Tax=Flavobacterium sp. TaxID=239 RepID=UPI002605C332|nr:hypothetical protein [Flavobacterium sp.]
MKNKLSLLFAFLLMPVAYSQVYQWGEKFEFDAVAEMDPTFVLKDNYNTYLFTAMDFGGLMAKHQMVLRKFDQKNKLVETFTYDFPKFDPNTLQDYLGFAEGTNGKLAVFTKTYSKKALKCVIYKHEFDKATSKFTSTELLSTPIVSNSKSGDALLQKSESGLFTAINYRPQKEKDGPEKNIVMVIDDKLNVSWQKEFQFTDKFFTESFAVSPSGKVVLKRKASGWKVSHYLVYTSADMQDVRNIEAEVVLHQPHVIAIGSQEYVLVFNYPAKGLRSGDFGNLLLYDLQNGRTLSNSKMGELNPGNAEDILMRHIAVENNEITIFTEAKVEVKLPAGAPTPGPGEIGFMEKTYDYGPSNVVVLNIDGSLKNIGKLAVDNGRAKIFHSYGLVNIKGDYWINTADQNGFYKYADSTKKVNFGYNYTDGDQYRNQSWQYIKQLVTYYPDTNKIVLVRLSNKTEMSLVSVTGIPQ